MIRITLKGSDETVKLLKRFPERMRIALVRPCANRDSHPEPCQDQCACLSRFAPRLDSPRHHGEKGKLVGHVGSALAYAPVLESGRTIGWFPPVSELKVWARRKLGDERLAFVVGRAIKRRGFKAQPYLLPAFEAGTSRIQTIFESRLREAIQAEGGKA